MRIYENIILDKNIDNIDNINTFLNKRKGMADYYALCVSPVGNGIMEILSLSAALKKVNNYKDYGIIAVLKGRDSIVNLSAKLVENWLGNNESLKGMREYYNSKCK